MRAQTLTKMNYTTVIPYTLQDESEREYEVDLQVSADCVYEPAKISGPMDECYHGESSCEITEIVLLDCDEKLRKYITAYDLELIEEKVWEDFRSGE